MLTSIPFFALPLPVPVPPLLAEPPPEPPFAPGVPFGAPPGTPGCLPSGERETRAARFPCGGTTGAGGAGDAERAMKVAAAFPFATPDWAEATSGAGTTSVICARCGPRGGGVRQHRRRDIREFLVQCGEVGSGFGGQLHFAKLTRAQLGERLLADLQARTRRSGQLLELHDVGKVRKNFRRLERRGGIN